MWIQFLNDNKIPYTVDTSADRLLIFGRDVQKDTVYSWIKKSKKYNLTPRQIYNTIQYSLPFEVLTEMSIEELLERNLTNHTKYLYYKKLKKAGILTSWVEGEKWELEAINHPELGKRILTREVINKHLAKKHPIEYIFKRQYVKPDAEGGITNDTLLKYNIVTPIQLKMFKELSAYKIYPIFKDNPSDFYKIEYEGEVYNIRSYRLRELREGLKNSKDRFSTVERITAFIKGEEPKIKKPRVRRSGITYKSKEKKFECKCKKCNQEFKSGDVKTQYCDVCRSPQMCKCGCGQIVKTPGRSFAPGCGLRGRSYRVADPI